MWGISDRWLALRGAVLGALAFALLLPSALGALSTPELVREQTLYSALLQAICSGEEPSRHHDGTPAPLSGCDYCPSACTIGCAAPVTVAIEIGRRLGPHFAALRPVLTDGSVGGIGRPEDRLPRGPPLAS